MLFTLFKQQSIELLKQESSNVNHFGWNPDYGVDGIFDLLTDGTFFRFDLPGYLWR
jgi:hypothetical protein